MGEAHHSWLELEEEVENNKNLFWTEEDASKEKVIELQRLQEKEARKIKNLTSENKDLMIDSQYNNIVPVLDSKVLLNLICTSDTEKRKCLAATLSDMFYQGGGCFVVRSGYTSEVMEKFNDWCEKMINGDGQEETEGNNNEKVSEDPNFVHPTQKGKFMINDVLSRMVGTDPMLLYTLLYDSQGAYILHWLVDVLLGFGKVGAAAAHWITPTSNTRQLSHVDFPLNINSSPFWVQDVEKMMRLTTVHQMNTMLPHYSCQVLIAADQMDATNGSTEVIPCSQSIASADLAIVKDSKFYKILEESSLFQNVVLEQGDILFFNRRLIHRGGANMSQKRRNALIMQYVCLWGVGQELINMKSIATTLLELHQNKSNKQTKEREEFQDFLTRIQPPYPKDTRLGT